MRFITIATSALIAGSALAAPTSRGHHGNHHNINHHSSSRHARYSKAEGEQTPDNTQAQVAPKEQESFFLRPLDISKVINPKDGYNTIQELAKIPEDQFINSVQDWVNKFQAILDVSFDFVIRVELLDEESLQELQDWFTEAFPKYESFTREELTAKQDEAAADLSNLIDIVYQDESVQFLDEIKKLLPNTITF